MWVPVEFLRFFLNCLRSDFSSDIYSGNGFVLFLSSFWISGAAICEKLVKVCRETLQRPRKGNIFCLFCRIFRYTDNSVIVFAISTRSGCMTWQRWLIVSAKKTRFPHLSVTLSFCSRIGTCQKWNRWSWAVFETTTMFSIYKSVDGYFTDNNTTSTALWKVAGAFSGKDRIRKHVTEHADSWSSSSRGLVDRFCLVSIPGLHLGLRICTRHSFSRYVRPFFLVCTSCGFS